jgi:phosphoribosylanthranilate isomerase
MGLFPPASRRPLIKFCGFTRTDDVRAAVALGIDAIGLNLARGPRKITVEQAARLRRDIPASVTTVALFVNADEDTILAALAATACDAIQLHGDEPPELAERLRARVPVIRAFAVRDAASIAAIHGYPADMYLLDAAVPGQSGGTGMAWNHALVRNVRFDRPWMLAGGLRPDNAATAATVGADALDAASGIESAPGLKDVEKMAAFVRAVRD